MKSKLLVVLFLLIGISSVCFAQTQSCSGSWALTTNGNCTVSSNGALSGTSISRANPAPIPTISYNSSYGANSDKWDVTSLNTGRYYEYTLTANANVTLSSLSVVLRSNGTGVHAEIRYSLDDFSSYTTLLSDYTLTANSNYSYSNSTLSINMEPDDKLTVRIYGWNAATSSVLFYNKSMVISGLRKTTETDFFRTKADGNWDETSVWESSANGASNWIAATLTPTATASTTTITHNLALRETEGCGNLTFNGGSIDFGDYDLTIDGTLSGTPHYTYSGSGVPSKTGTAAIVTVTTTTPTSIPTDLNTLILDPGAGNTVYLPNSSTSVTVDFSSGSLTLGDYQMVVTDVTSGTSSFIFNGSGGLSGEGANYTNVILEVNTSDTIPPILNDITVNPGENIEASLPGDVTTTTLTFIDGSLGWNRHILTLADKDFGLTGSDTISALWVFMEPVAYTWYGYTSIEHTWHTTGTFVGTVDLIFSYPAYMSMSLEMRAYTRNHFDGDSPWKWIAVLNTVDNGDYRSVTLPGVNDLNGDVTDRDWTLTDNDQELPVELTSFSAELSQQIYITLKWVTQSETNSVGYNIYRNSTSNLASAIKVNANLISSTNTSIEHTYYFRDVVVTNDDAYYYWLQDVSSNGIETLHGPIIATLGNNGQTTPTPNIPLVTSVKNIFPNPFTPSTTINYGVATKGVVSINVYNAKGQMVRNLQSGVKEANNYRVVWDGKDLSGRSCASGVYIIELVSGRIRSTTKAILLK